MFWLTNGVIGKDIPVEKSCARLQMATGLSNMIKPFCGEGDMVAWLKKVELVAKLQKIEDVATVIPLFLEGDALAMYLEMNERDADMIRLKLTKAFAEGPFGAYERLIG